MDVTGQLVRVRSGPPGIGKTRRINAQEIDDVVVNTGMTQQETATQSARVWYDIVIQRSPGRRVVAGRRITSRAKAERLAASCARCSGSSAD